LSATARPVVGTGQAQEPQLFPDLPADDRNAGPEIPPNPYQATVAGTPHREPRDDAGRGRRFLWIGVGSISAVAILLPLLIWLNHDQQTAVADTDLPVIAAEEGPEKIRPADEGGMHPQNQDVAIYDAINGAAQEHQPQPEVLLDEAETPIPLPDPAPAPLPPADDTSAIPAVPPAFDVTQDATAAAKVEPSAGGGNAAEQAPAAEDDISKIVEQTASLGETFRVQVAAVKTKDGAQATWAKLQKKHPQLLGALEMMVVEVDKSDGKFYRVQAGPFADRATAVDACMALKAVDQGCLVVNP
jgi:cell division septation protein DedD